MKQLLSIIISLAILIPTTVSDAAEKKGLSPEFRKTLACIWFYNSMLGAFTEDAKNEDMKEVLKIKCSGTEEQDMLRGIAHRNEKIKASFLSDLLTYLRELKILDDVLNDEVNGLTVRDYLRSQIKPQNEEVLKQFDLIMQSFGGEITIASPTNVIGTDVNQDLSSAINKERICREFYGEYIHEFKLDTKNKDMKEVLLIKCPGYENQDLLRGIAHQDPVYENSKVDYILYYLRERGIVDEALNEKVNGQTVRDYLRSQIKPNNKERLNDIDSIMEDYGGRLATDKPLSKNGLSPGFKKRRACSRFFRGKYGAFRMMIINEDIKEVLKIECNKERKKEMLREIAHNNSRISNSFLFDLLSYLKRRGVLDEVLNEKIDGQTVKDYLISNMEPHNEKVLLRILLIMTGYGAKTSEELK